MSDSPAEPDATSDSAPLRLGAYRLLRELGRGGQAVVWLAEDERDGRRVALKVLDMQAGAEEAVRRFRREAELTRKLDHPHICTVYEAGVEKGAPFIATRYVEGATLAAHLKEAREAAAPPEGASEAPTVALGSRGSAEGRTGPAADASRTAPAAPAWLGGTSPDAVRRAVAFIDLVARALHAAHEAGVFHRDVKPANLMVSPDGTPVVLDFGLAGDATHDEPTLTRTGDVFGTPAYMSPEQIRGDKRHVDRRVDVYALGVTLYECVTLKRPYEAPTREALFIAIMSSEPPDPRKLNPHVSENLAAVIEAALEKSPDRRYQTALAFADDLRAVLGGRGVAVRRISPWGRLRRWGRRRPAAAALALTLIVAAPSIAALAGYLIAGAPEAERGREQIRYEATELALQRGYIELGEGSIVAAEAAFREAERLDPSNALATAGLVSVERRLGRPDDALARLDAARAAGRDRPAFALLRARVLEEAGRGAEMAAVSRSIPAPVHAVDHFIFGVESLQRGHLTNDARAFRTARLHLVKAVFRAEGARPLYLFEYAHAAGHEGSPEDRAEAAAVLQARFPASAYASYYAGFAVGQHDPVAAVASYRRAVALDPGLAMARLALGYTLSTLGNHDEALRLLASQSHAIGGSSSGTTFYAGALNNAGRTEEAVAVLRSYSEAHPQDFGVLGMLGALYCDQRDFDAAIPLMERALALNPYDAPGRGNYGRALLFKGRTADAVQAFDAATQIAPEDADWWAHSADALKRLGRRDEAVEAARRAVSCPIVAAKAYGRAARVLSASGLDAESLPWTRKAIAAEPRSIDWRFNLALALGRLGDDVAAAAAYEDVLALDPTDVEANTNRALVLVRLRLREQGVAAAERMTILAPTSVAAYVGLGRVLTAAGRHREAFAATRKAADLATAAGVQLPPHTVPSARSEWAMRAEDLFFRATAEGEAVVPDEIAGDVAWVAAERGADALAYRLFVRALDFDPDDKAGAERSASLGAAQAALRLACGGGDPASRPKGADDAGRTDLLREAARRLRETVIGLDESDEAHVARVRERLAAMRREPEGAPLRAGWPGLASLSDADAGAWIKLRLDLDRLLGEL
jgi:serine/threonine protein kinase/predicted Zn-dependent protease